MPLAHVRREVSYDFQNTWSVFSFRVYEAHDWCVRIEDTDGIKGFQILKLLRHALNEPCPLKSTATPSPLDLSYHKRRLGIDGPLSERRGCECCRAATQADEARVIPVSEFVVFWVCRGQIKSWAVFEYRGQSTGQDWSRKDKPH